MKSGQNLKNKVFLVTGGTGFIGSHACNKLIEHGAIVHSISRKKKENDKVHWSQGDLSNMEFVRDLFQKTKPDVVIHLASEVTGKREMEYVIPTLSGNLISAVNLMICATEHKCERIILAGSLEEPDKETTAPIPSSPYAAAKWASSAYARMFYNLYNTPVVLARLFMVYGPGQKDLKKFIPYISLSISNNEIPKLANGAREVDWIYVDDIVEGLLAMAIKPGIESQTIDLGTGNLYTTGHVAEKLCEISQKAIKPDFGAIPERPMEQVKKANIEETNKILDWEPKVSLHEGLAKTYWWYNTEFESGNIKL